MNLLKTLLAGAAAITGAVEKRAGLYVCRQILNAETWAKWAVSAGIPDPLPADKIHVTVVHSAVDVKTKPLVNSYEILTERAVIQHLGANGDVLVVLFEDCWLADRHWFFRANGATSDWGSYRPHVTLSYSAAGFEIPPEALSSMPETLILGPEIHAALDEDAMKVVKKSVPADPAVHDPDPEDVAAAAKALTYVMVNKVGDAYERAVLSDIAASRPVSSADIRALSMADWAAKAFEGADMMASPSTAPEPADRGSNESQLVKRADEERIAYGWASVSATVDGNIVTDLQGDQITTEAQKQLLHGLMRDQRAGNLDHVGPVVGEIVEGIVFTKELWKALEPYTGQEGLFIGMHFPQPEDWAKTEGRDMFSIGCKAISIEVEDGR